MIVIDDDDWDDYRNPNDINDNDADYDSTAVKISTMIMMIITDPFAILHFFQSSTHFALNLGFLW